MNYDTSISRNAPLVGLCSPLMGSGKTTVAKELEKSFGFTRLRFAGALKEMTKTFLSSFGLPWATVEDMVDGDLKDTAIPALGGVTTRHLMQTIGTEWGRSCVADNVWIVTAMAQAKTYRADDMPVVFDDVRYRNEADAIVEAGGVIVRVIRPCIPPSCLHEHPSEGGMDGYNVSDVLMNDIGTLGVPRRVADMVNFLNLAE